MFAATVHYKRLGNLRLRFMQSSSTRAQLARFLLVGGSCMVIDLLTYRTCLFLTSTVSLSKGMGFIVGTTVAFFANRAFTFQHDDGNGLSQVPRFLAVYAATLLVNVGINSGMLHALGMSEVGINASFAFATICSSALNFVGMKKLVFRR